MTDYLKVVNVMMISGKKNKREKTITFFESRWIFLILIRKILIKDFT